METKDPNRNTAGTMRRTEEILADRGGDYGNFEQMAHAAQALKSVMGSFDANLSTAQQEAIDMICTKMSRLACGDPNKIDTWQDIAGYAELIVRILKQEKFA